MRGRLHGLRWAAIRATAEELYRFARYAGIMSEHDRKYLMKRLSRYEFFERGQAVTGHKTLTMVQKYRAQANQRAASKRAQQRRDR